MAPTVLILDANQRSALATIRSLGQRGIKVLAADTKPNTLGGASKFTRKKLIYPDPASDASAFVDAVAQMVPSNSIDVIFPMTDITTMLLAQAHRKLEPARLACSSQESYEALTDKASLVEIAQDLKIPTPTTQVVHNTSEMLNVIATWDYPIVIKPSRSRYLKDNHIISTQVRIIRSPAQLDRELTTLRWLDDIPCLIQQFIPGFGAGAFILASHGETLARFAHKRIREKPPSGGVSVLCESTAPDMQLVTLSDRLMSKVRWHGPAMVEYRIDHSGQPYLMEVNGRFWGSLQLSIDSGIDFPWLMLQLVLEQPVSKQQHYVVGNRLRWLLGDIDNLLLQLRGKDIKAPSKTRALAEFLGTFLDRKCQQEIFRRRDFRPALHEFSAWCRALR